MNYLTSMEKELNWMKGRVPYGTVAGVLPYDAPTIMFARLVGSARVGGNPCAVSFSSTTPRVREIVREQPRLSLTRSEPRK